MYIQKKEKKKRKKKGWGKEKKLLFCGEDMPGASQVGNTISIIVLQYICYNLDFYKLGLWLFLEELFSTSTVLRSRNWRKLRTFSVEDPGI